MAKRNLSLFKKTAMEPEVVDEVPEALEEPAGGGSVTVEYDSSLEDVPPDFAKPLSKVETKRRDELEGVIKNNMGAFLAVGYAMREIREKLLYRTTHRSFADYCKDIWEMARSTAYQFIDAADVVDIVRNCGHIEWIPQNESQARAFIKFKKHPENIEKIAIEAFNTAPKGKISAAHIRKTARRLHLEKVRETVQKTKKKTNQAPKISEEFRKAFNDFLDAINIERANEYKNTDRNEVIRHVHIVLEALEAEL